MSNSANAIMQRLELAPAALMEDFAV